MEDYHLRRDNFPFLSRNSIFQQKMFIVDTLESERQRYSILVFKNRVEDKIGSRLTMCKNEEMMRLWSFLVSRYLGGLTIERHKLLKLNGNLWSIVRKKYTGAMVSKPPKISTVAVQFGTILILALKNSTMAYQALCSLSVMVHLNGPTPFGGSLERFPLSIPLSVLKVKMCLGLVDFRFCRYNKH